MNNLKAKIAIVLLLASLSALFVPKAADAAGIDGVCASGEMCAWKNSGAGGPIFDNPNSVTNYSYFNFWASCGTWGCSNVNDEISSVKNRGTQCPMTMFKNSGYTGSSVFIPNDGVVYNIGGGFNDSLSSGHFCH